MRTIDPKHDETRTALRVLGPLVIVIGVMMMVYGISSTISYGRAFERDMHNMQQMPKFDGFPGSPGGPSQVTVEFPPGTSEADKEAVRGELKKQYPESFPGDTASGSESGSAPGPENGLFTVFGLLVVGVGIGLTSYGYMGAVARYEAAEVAPVAADTVNYVAEETSEGIEKIARAIGEGMNHEKVSQVVCPSCKTANDADARFCKSCAAPLVKTCPACKKSNAPDARFCDHCGAEL